jgi:hypothetical protein
MVLDTPPRPIKENAFDELLNIVEPHIYNKDIFGEVTLAFSPKKHLTLQDLCKSFSNTFLSTIDIHRIIDGIKCRVKTHEEFKKLLSNTNHFEDQSFEIGERDEFCFSSLIINLKCDIILTISHSSINIRGRLYESLDNDVVKQILHVAKKYNIKTDIGFGCVF